MCNEQGANMTPDWAVIERRSDADRVSNALSYQERVEAEEDRLAGEFKQAIRAGDISGVTLGQQRSQTIFNPCGKFSTVTTVEPLWQTMVSTIEGNNGLSRIAMRALMIAANTGHVVAQEAIASMAREYGKQTAVAV